LEASALGSLIAACPAWKRRRENSKTVQDRAIFTMADQQKVVYDLSNGASFNDLEQPLTKFSR